jgi:hypothetical protein
MVSPQVFRITSLDRNKGRVTLVIYTNLFSANVIDLQPMSIDCNDRASLQGASLLVTY